jgi:putative endonuclease
MKKTTTATSVKRRSKPHQNASGQDASPDIVTSKLCYCYIVECSDGSFYTGWAVDAERRLKVHNSGRGARYTSTRRPVKLVYVEPQPDRTTAMKRERAIKKLTRNAKLALINGA